MRCFAKSSGSFWHMFSFLQFVSGSVSCNADGFSFFFCLRPGFGLGAGGTRSVVASGYLPDCNREGTNTSQLGCRDICSISPTGAHHGLLTKRTTHTCTHNEFVSCNFQLYECQSKWMKTYNLNNAKRCNLDSYMYVVCMNIINVKHEDRESEGARGKVGGVDAINMYYWQLGSPTEHAQPQHVLLATRESNYSMLQV